ncbi:DUF2187 family protein [Bacillus kwashiorkori]|uniref:DUF2187 family protein n=1 Tax=Bacillus kwashiorkori TaxID=1522318 RepID=UPI003B82D805
MEKIIDSTDENKVKGKVVKANIGDKIQIKRGLHKGKKGNVIQILENSVIVELGMNAKTGEPIKTVVNHKNYKIGK